MLEFSIGNTYKVKWNGQIEEYEFYKDDILMPKKIDKLYKFMSFNENTISSLLGNFFWLTNPVSFNDPFDCNKNLIVDYSESDELKMKARNYYDNIGVVSFTEKLENPLMWAHYTNSYNGIVLEFDSSDFESFKELEHLSDFKLAKVMYPEYIGPLQTGFKFAEDVMLSAKIKSWEYENEWRIIGKLNNSKNRYLTYNPKILKNIYIGYNLFEKNSSAVQIITQIRALNFPEANIYYVYPHHERFGALVCRKVM